MAPIPDPTPHPAILVTADTPRAETEVSGRIVGIAPTEVSASIATAGGTDAIAGAAGAVGVARRPAAAAAPESRGSRSSRCQTPHPRCSHPWEIR